MARHIQWAMASCPQAEAVWQRRVESETCPACSCCLAWAVFSLELSQPGRDSNCGRALWVRQPLPAAASLMGSIFSDSRQAQPLIPCPPFLKLGPSTHAPAPGHKQASGPQGRFSARALLPFPSLLLQAHHPEALCPQPPPQLRPGPERPPHLGPKGIGDPLRKVATLALRVAHHPDVLRVAAVTDAPAIRPALVQGALCAHTVNVVQPDGSCVGGDE